VEVDVAVLDVGGVDGEEHRQGVDSGYRDLQPAGQHAAEQRRGQRREHEHRVDLRGEGTPGAEKPLLVSGDGHTKP